MPAYAVGVDLGMTYTAAAILRDGHVDVVELGDRVASVASVLWFRDDHTVVVGEAALRRAEMAPDRMAREFKRRFGDPIPIMVAGAPMSADALTARLLHWVVETVTEQEGVKPAAVGVTHPANWGLYKQDLLAQAVRLAGVHHATLFSEPRAAAESHANAVQVTVGDVVAVYDLGGGTFDAAVLQRTESGFEPLGQPEGIERLGGIDFDEAVFNYVRQTLGPELNELNELNGPKKNDPVVAQALGRLREECVRAKETLSSDTEVIIPVAMPGIYTMVRLTRGEFEEMIRPSIASTIEMLSRAITSAGLTPAEVSKVLLVGGSSRIPLVSLMISAELGCPVALDTYPKHAVAMGSAWLAGGNRRAEPAGPVTNRDEMLRANGDETAWSPQPLPLPPQSLPPQPPPSPPPPRQLWWTIAAACAVAVAGIVLLIWHPWSGSGPTDRASALQHLHNNAPLGSDCREALSPSPGALAELVCTTRPGLDELLLAALPDADGIKEYIRHSGLSDASVLSSGSCPQDLPVRQTWERDGRTGTLYCVAIDNNTHYIWTFDDLNIVGQLQGAAETPFPRDVTAVSKYFGELRYPPPGG